MESLPVRGAWVEMPFPLVFGDLQCSRSPCGERGLKSPLVRPCGITIPRRSPCGERGLKYESFFVIYELAFVAPRAGSVG